MQPVVYLRVAAKISAKQLSLQLRQLDLIIRQRVFRCRASFLKRNLIVLPRYVAEHQSSRTSELLQRPVSAASKVGEPFSQIVPSGNRCSLRAIDVSFVACVQVRIVEIADASARRER